MPRPIILDLATIMLYDWLPSGLYSIRGSAEYEKSVEFYGPARLEKTKALRQSVARLGNSYQQLWLLASDGNLSMALMATSRVAEELPWMERIITADRKGYKHNVFLTNTCNFYQLLGRYDDVVNILDAIHGYHPSKTWARKHENGLLSRAWGWRRTRTSLQWLL